MKWLGDKLRFSVGVVGCVLLALAGLLACTHVCVIEVYGIGTPDAYGNVICWLCVYQYNGTAWNLLLNHTTDSNWTQRVVHSQPINITVQWRLNNTLADDAAEARSFTRVYMNLTGVWTNEELNATGSVTSDASYYYGVELAYWNQTGKPTTGVTYDVATRYEAYY